MKVVFPYCKDSDTSFGSPTGWDLNIANLFSLRGHEVYFGNEFVESGQKADVLFVYERLDLWDNDRSRDKLVAYQECADKILMGVFDPANTAHLTAPPKNCLLVTPYRSLGTECMVIPYAYYEDRPAPGFDRKTLGWTVRNPFAGKEMDGPKIVHLEHLKACHKLVEEGYRLVIFSNNSYYEWPTPDKPRILLDELRENPLVTVVDHLPYSEYLALLGETSVVLPLNGIGSTTEALKLGSLPLAWENVVNIYSKVPNGRNYLSITSGVVYDKLSRLLTDEQLYRTEYQVLFDAAGIYSLEESLILLDRVIERL